MSNIDEMGMGAFRPELTPTGKHNPAGMMMSPRADADSLFATTMAKLAYEDVEDNEEEEEPDLIKEHDCILNARVRKGRKYFLEETLLRLEENVDYAGKFKMKMDKITNTAKERISDINEEEEQPLDEFSGAIAGGGGPVPPMGYTAKGKPETRTQRKKRQKFNREKSFPYR